MPSETRERLLDVALEQFAARGFEGTSIAGIADALGLTKQALLHHFGSKERLYGEVLALISRAFEARVAARRPSAEADALVALLGDMAADSRAHRAQTRLLMRELLDNSERAQRAGHWYLKSFLDALAERVLALPGWKTARREQALAVIYQLLGAVNYFAVSGDTLAAMYGAQRYHDLEAVFDAQFTALALGVLAAGPAPSSRAARPLRDTAARASRNARP